MDKKTLESLLQGCGVTLYDIENTVENEQKIYRVLITSDEPITLNKCSEVTKIISPIIDLDPPVLGEYFLEVSSPGIDRKLSKIEHFQKSIGDLVKIKLQDSTKFKAKILNVADHIITFYDKDSKSEKNVNFTDIIKAKTYFEW